VTLPLTEVLRALEQLAPLQLAEDWDNVGLLIDPREAGRELDVTRILVTIDATDRVVDEAIRLRADLLVAYHPPLFRPQKRWSARAQRLPFAAARHDFAVYSPHTALDAAAGGLNDWLAEAFGTCRSEPIVPVTRTALGAECKLVVFVPEAQQDTLRAALARAGAGRIGNYAECSFGLNGEGTFFGQEGTNPAVGGALQLERVREVRLEMVCDRAALPAIQAAIAEHHPYEEPAWDVYPLLPAPSPTTGAGRRLKLEQPLTLEKVIQRVKQHLGVAQLRVAASPEHQRGAPIQHVALGAGAAGSLLDGAASAELILTGEMRHHDVLAHLQRGRSVVLSEHTHTERGYLPRLRDRLLAALTDSVEIFVSEVDEDPLVTV